MSPLPALLLVYGAWRGPWCRRHLIGELADADVHTVALPSSRSASAVPGDLRDDAAAVPAAVAAAQGPVVASSSRPTELATLLREELAR